MRLRIVAVLIACAIFGSAAAHAERARRGQSEHTFRTRYLLPALLRYMGVLLFRMAAAMAAALQIRTSH